MAVLNPTVLVVDDDAELLSSLTLLLEAAGFIAVPACEGMEAGQAMRNCRFDVVLTDLMMPTRSGFELISDLRKSNPRLPIVAMTGGDRMQRSEVDLLTQASQLGARAVLKKPFTREQLLEALRQAMAEAGR